MNKIQEQILQECFALEDLQKLLKKSSKDITIIDVRSQEEYVENHIPAAINIPLGELQARSKELPIHSIIITVCGKGGGRSAEAAVLLKKSGFSKANYLCGGTFGWFDLVPF